MLTVACRCCSRCVQEMHTKDDWTKRHSDGGAPNKITGTMLYSPLSVLDGEAHTVCSMLEGLYLSVLFISTDGKAANFRKPPRTIESAKQQRLTHLLLRQDDEHLMHETLRPLLLNLRDLFYQPGSALTRTYNQDVTPDDVHNVCQKVVPIVELD